MITYFFILTVFYLPIKLILYLIIFKFGKLSYDEFSAAGFAYDKDKDNFYTIKDAWQKKMGYCHLYDVGAPLFQMIIDTEPIKFSYNNKNWLITFWKGQYGITTGAEIGIYATKQQKISKRTIYYPIDDNEQLNMVFTLYKKGQQITKIQAKHWWLAVFKMGMFSNPRQLSMDIEIEFPNQEMLNAFLSSFKKKRYKPKDYKIVNNTFSFTYKKPHTKKVWTRNLISDAIRQRINKKNVTLYNKYAENIIDDTNSVKKYKLIKLVPDILKNPTIQPVKLKHTSSFILFNDNIYSKMESKSHE